MLSIVFIAPTIHAPIILKKIILIINPIVIGIESLTNIQIVIPNPMNKSAIDTNSLELPLWILKDERVLKEFYQNHHFLYI